MIDRTIVWSGRNPVLVCLLLGAALAWGVLAIRSTPLDAIPDLSDTQVIIYTPWEGRSPTLVEDQITYPITSQFTSAPKVKFVRGESMFGKSFVYVIFQDGTDLYWARSRVMEYLSSVRASLPEGANPTIGPDATGVGWVFEYALVDTTGTQSLADLRSLQDWHLKFALGSVPGVAEVATVGGFVKEYQVNVDPDKLLAYHVTINEVVDAVRQSNLDVGGKTLEVATTEYYIRGRGYLHSVADLEQIVLKTDAQGTPVLVSQVATVTLGPDLRSGIAELDGRGETVGGIVVMRQGENALQVIDAVKKKLREVASSLPAGVKVTPVYDRSSLIKDSIRTLRAKLLEECLMVSVVCLVFLGQLRSSLVAIVVLPLALVLSFIPFSGLHLTANIMSLGGMAIAIGAMVDAAVIMIENAHRQLEEATQQAGQRLSERQRVETILAAAQQVGRPLFFSLLVITISFAPVFTLEAQEGRLFKPLALTKTFAMFFAAILSITVVPVLMRWFIRGPIRPERSNVVNQWLIAAYGPAVNWVLRHRWWTLSLAGLLLVLTVFPVGRLGYEFMPALNEGTILFMPTAQPGLANSEAARILQIQDRILRNFPEVASVFGKAGQAETATDPAPLSMMETVVQLKPRSEWRPGTTWDGLIGEMNQAVKLPGLANIFWMPIQTRTEMMTTGFRSNLGIKIFGTDLLGINRVAAQVEQALQDFPETRSVFAEKLLGGRYLDIDVKREALGRYGLRVADVNRIVETAIGGRTVDTTVEGRERYPISVRYARDFRNDLSALRAVLVPTPLGAQIPLAEVADLHFRSGPPSIRSEHGQLVGFVFVDTTSHDLVRYVEAASRRIHERVTFPAGYYLQWAGSFEYFLRLVNRLEIVGPLTLLIIVVLLYLNTRSMVRTGLVLLAVPFSLIGAAWLVFALGYSFSGAVAVGLIALAGLDAETGVVMLYYLDQACEARRQNGRLQTLEDLRAAVREGAVHRIRPKIMTVAAILFGLLPILWSAGTGADVMKRIAAPMVGGIVTSAVMELLLYPVIYVLWQGRRVRNPADSAGDHGSPTTA